MLNSDIVKIEKIHQETGIFEIAWKITYLCNYRCSFCIQGDPLLHVKRAEGESSDHRMAVLDSVVRFIEGLEGYTCVRLNLVGGEVTTVKELPHILEVLCACKFKGDIRFQIITNFSKPADYYNDLCDIVSRYDTLQSRRCFRIRASFYKAYVSQEEFTKKLLNISNHMMLTNAIASKKKGIDNKKDPELQLAVVYPVQTEADCNGFFEMKNNGHLRYVNVSPIRLLGIDDNLDPAIAEKMINSENKDKVHIKVTDRYGNTTNYGSMNLLGLAIEDHEGFCPNGYICDAGLHSMAVNPFGDVKRCVAVPDRQTIGNLVDGSYKGFSQAQLCTWKRCNNSRFTFIKKADEETT